MCLVVVVQEDRMLNAQVVAEGFSCSQTLPLARRLVLQDTMQM